jgi:hypothetical protein
MSFYKEILPFADYIHSIRKLEAYLSFDIKFPTKWGIPKNIVDEGQVLPFDVGVENQKGFSFVSKIEESEISLTITKILKIIKINKEREIKEKLFKETIERLKQTFEKTELEKLQKLYFDFETDYSENELNDETDGQSSISIELAGEGKEER